MARRFPFQLLADELMGTYVLVPCNFVPALSVCVYTHISFLQSRLQLCMYKASPILCPCLVGPYVPGASVSP
jgi:hypothetical protein